MEHHKNLENKRCGNPHDYDSRCISRKKQRSKLSTKIKRPNPTSTENPNCVCQGHETEKPSQKLPFKCTEKIDDVSGGGTSNARDPLSEHHSNSDNYKVKRLLIASSVNDQQDTSCRTKSHEDMFLRNEIFRHDTNTLGVKQTLPFLSIEVGEPLSLTPSTENVLDPSVDFQPLTSPFEHLTLNSLNQFPFSLPPTPSIFPELPLEYMARSSNNVLPFSAIGRLVATNPFAHHKCAEKIILPPPLSRLSLPFVPPFRQLNSPLWADAHAFLRSSQLSVLKSLQEELTTSNRILIPPGIVTDMGDQAGCIPNQGLQVIGTIDDVTALNGAHHNSNIPNPESLSTYRALHHLLRPKSFGVEIPQCLPFLLAHPEDSRRLSSAQVLLRQQIEVFSATEDDVLTHARGRNKPITLKQVGIRCRHCANLTLNGRKKGSVYFPFTLMGIYQASQNMASTHIFQDNCNEFPSEIKLSIVQRMGCKSTAGSGREFWADAARCLGLLDTDLGIRFIRDLAASNERIHQELFFRYG